MSRHDIFELVRVVLVIALVVMAAVVATPKGRVPLAFRGLLKVLRKQNAPLPLPPSPPEAKASTSKRLAAFGLVLVAVLLSFA